MVEPAIRQQAIVRKALSWAGTACRVGAAGETEEAANVKLSSRGRRCYDIQEGSTNKAPFGRWDLGPVPGDGTLLEAGGRYSKPGKQSRDRMLSCALLCASLCSVAAVQPQAKVHSPSLRVAGWEEAVILLRLPLLSLTMCSSPRGSG